MKGKILFCSTSQVFDENLEEFPIKLQITRYIKKGLLTGFIHTTGLSPSEELLNTTNYKWKKMIFTDFEKEKMKNGKTHTWWDLYIDLFSLEMSMRYDFMLNYQRLKEHLDNGTNIIACCYCEDYEKCHRSLIAKALKDEGYEVILK